MDAEVMVVVFPYRIFFVIRIVLIKQKKNNNMTLTLAWG